MSVPITINNLFNVYVTSHGAIIMIVLSVQGPIDLAVLFSVQRSTQ